MTASPVAWFRPAVSAISFPKFRVKAIIFIFLPLKSQKRDVSNEKLTNVLLKNKTNHNMESHRQEPEIHVENYDL